LRYDLLLSIFSSRKRYTLVSVLSKTERTSYAVGV
jgi:hypothetical protein